VSRRIEVSVRKRLLRWGSWFAVGNAALFAIVGLQYLWHYTPVAPVGWIYAVLAFAALWINEAVIRRRSAR